MPDSAISNFGTRIADGFLAGHGTDHPVQRGLVSVGGAAGTFLGGPILGQLIRRIGGRLLDRHYGTGQYANQTSPVMRQTFDTSPQAPGDVNFGVSPPSFLGGVSPSIPGMQLGPGVYRQPIPVPMPGMNVSDVNFGITPLSPSAMQFRGPDGQMYNGSGAVNNMQGGGWAGQAGGGASQGGGIGTGWTGINGDAARGMFSGMRDGSNQALAQNEYSAFVRGNRT